MIKSVLQSTLSESQKKLYAHYDYFGYIIPSTLFVFGLMLIELVIFKTSMAKKTLIGFVQFVSEISISMGTILEIFLSLILIILSFNIIYCLGHILNGFSALIFDRLLVKKLLKYPFQLYIKKKNEKALNDHEIFRSAVLESSYFDISLINLFPVYFLELVYLIIIVSNPLFKNWFNNHFYLLIFLGILFQVVHFGCPSSRFENMNQAVKLPRLKSTRATYVIFYLSVFLAQLVLIIYFKNIMCLIFAPSISFLFVIVSYFYRASRGLGGSVIAQYFNYTKYSIFNWVYFLANIIDYGSMPSRGIIERSFNLTRINKDEEMQSNDFYWLSNIRLQNLLPLSHPTAYSFLSMYGMIRNLLNVTVLLFTYFLIMMINREYIISGSSIVTLSVIFVLLILILYIRYLYLYSGYYSKYLLRANVIFDDLVENKGN